MGSLNCHTSKPSDVSIPSPPPVSKLLRGFPILLTASPSLLNIIGVMMGPNHRRLLFLIWCAHCNDYLSSLSWSKWNDDIWKKCHGIWNITTYFVSHFRLCSHIQGYFWKQKCFPTFQGKDIEIAVVSVFVRVGRNIAANTCTRTNAACSLTFLLVKNQLSLELLPFIQGSLDLSC